MRGADGIPYIVQQSMVTYITGFFSDHELHTHPQSDAIVRDMPNFLIACYGALPAGRIELFRRHDRMTYEVHYTLDEENWRLDYDGGGQPLVVRRDEPKPKHIPPAPVKPAEPVMPTLTKPRRILQVD